MNGLPSGAQLDQALSEYDRNPPDFTP